MNAWGVAFAAIAYLLFLFVVAAFGDRRRKQSQPSSGRPIIYALSLAIYCTSWTFFGSVGLAATTGLDFLAIYVGPILAVTVLYPLYSHVIRVAKAERLTSVADFIASRHGKSSVVGAVAAIIAIVGTVPYIALQLKAIETSVETMLTAQPFVLAQGAPVDTALYISILLALFTIAFGTRHADATEHQDGLMLAVATESIVKLLAFLGVGLFVVFQVFDGFGDMVEAIGSSAYVSANFQAGITPSTFAIFTLLSLCAFFLLPRQFHVGVVEQRTQEELKAARWLFPLYLIAINLFVVPVALAGMIQLGDSASPDIYVLALPLSQGASAVTLLAFIGGLSAATAMVIVASVALSIMLSNNIVLPLMVRLNLVHSVDMSRSLLKIRRTAIFGILTMAYAYVVIAGDSAALAAIGLLSFAAVAQFAPSFFGGMLWRDGNGRGALAGMIGGFAMWFYTLLLPTLLDPNAPLLSAGPGGIAWLHPQAMFGLDMAPLTHGVLISLLMNCLLYYVFSKSRAARPLERMQANTFWYFDNRASGIFSNFNDTVTVGELRQKVSSYIGQERAYRAFSSFFDGELRVQERHTIADEKTMRFAEQLLASAIGAASARLVMSLMLRQQGQTNAIDARLLDDASEALLENQGILQTAINQVEQGISVFDEDFRLSSWNSQFRRLLDLPADLGQAGTKLSTIAEAVAERCTWEGDSVSDFTRQLLDQSEPWQVRLLATGRIVEIHANALPIGGHVVSWHDVTDRVQAAQALQLSNETLERRVEERTQELTQLNAELAAAREAAETANIGKTRFLAAVGHDVLQPLNAARLYASSLAERLAEEPTRQLAEKVDHSLESVEEILGAVLAISRLDAGALKPNRSDFALSDLFKRLDVEFRPSAEAKGLSLDVRDNGFAVHSDPALLHRLLQNLVSNAIKYSNSGSVTVDARLAGKDLEIEVIDTGTGIRSKDQKVVFEEFRRLDEARHTEEGLGLGLSIVRRIADTLGHNISLSSRMKRGTKFTVTVPVAIGVVAKSQQQGAAPTPSMPLSGLRVACIDNEPRILDGMQHLLSGWGCEVSCFGKSVDLLTALGDATPDVLIADYHLDGDTGLDVIEAVRSTGERSIACILLTADRSTAVRRMADAADIVMLTKPVKPAALRSLLTQYHNARSIAEAAE
ncbi:ATP-binding protein [Pseudahrensia aquimaris]|uniref:histidine kinase n=1 Tax=Pseudahrensia aquimaris TaxID=744461 RepID=A0ABW3FJW8_9HYPH